MIPVVTPEEMGAIDRAAAEPVEVLVERAGAAVARAAVDLLGGTYGRRVVVVAGKGNNGADGRDAARRLRARGVRVVELDAAGLEGLPPCDLVIDAAYGTGFRGSIAMPPAPEGAVVLAVDIPSGVDGLTGVAVGTPLRADRTVTFAALKPGLLLADGPGLAGDVRVADIGLDTSSARAHRVQASDVAGWLPTRPREAHKWQTAVWVVAGSPGMTGAAHLVSAAAMRAGAGYVRLSTPGVEHDLQAPVEVVGTPLPQTYWSGNVIGDLDRFAAIAIGPGLGTGEDVSADVAAAVAGADRPLVVDGDGLTALAAQGDPGALLAGRSESTVLTPHDGEVARLGGDAQDPDRFGATRDLAARLGATVLRKGPATLVAAPDGHVLVVAEGDARLATAGTGDVLTGTVAALLAGGLGAVEAAAAGAFVHARAGMICPVRGLVASDLVAHLPAALEALAAPTARR